MLKWLRKIFHKKPDPCDGCNKRKATEKELDDFMKYRGSLMGKE